MTLWNKNGTKPKYVSQEDRKNVIATEKGWVKRTNYVDNGGSQRSKDEILVAISELANLSSMGNPDVTDLYVSNSSGGSVLKANVGNKLYVVYSEPVTIGSSPTAMTITITNAANSSTVTATSNTNKASIVNANNTLVFDFTATNAGNYKVNAQTIGNIASSKVYSIAGGTSEAANGAISNTVSVALSTFSVI